MWTTLCGTGFTSLLPPDVKGIWWTSSWVTDELSAWRSLSSRMNVAAAPTVCGDVCEANHLSYTAAYPELCYLGASWSSKGDRDNWELKYKTHKNITLVYWLKMPVNRLSLLYLFFLSISHQLSPWHFSTQYDRFELYLSLLFHLSWFSFLCKS